MADEAKVVNPTQTMVFLGSSWGKGGRGARFLTVTPDQVEFSELKDLYKSKDVEVYGYKNVAKHVFLRVGGLYTVEYPEGDQGKRVFVNTFTFVKPWPNVEEAARLQATEKANEQSVAAYAMSKKASKVDPLKEALRPVRKAMLGTIGVDRAQLLAWCVAYITGAGEE